MLEQHDSCKKTRQCVFYYEFCMEIIFGKTRRVSADTGRPYWSHEIYTRDFLNVRFLVFSASTWSDTSLLPENTKNTLKRMEKGNKMMKTHMNINQSKNIFHAPPIKHPQT